MYGSMHKATASLLSARILDLLTFKWGACDFVSVLANSNILIQSAFAAYVKSSWLLKFPLKSKGWQHGLLHVLGIYHKEINE